MYSATDHRDAAGTDKRRLLSLHVTSTTAPRSVAGTGDRLQREARQWKDVAYQDTQRRFFVGCTVTPPPMSQKASVSTPAVEASGVASAPWSQAHVRKRFMLFSTTRLKPKPKTRVHKVFFVAVNKRKQACLSQKLIPGHSIELWIPCPGSSTRRSQRHGCDSNTFSFNSTSPCASKAVAAQCSRQSWKVFPHIRSRTLWANSRQVPCKSRTVIGKSSTARNGRRTQNSIAGHGPPKEHTRKQSRCVQIRRRSPSTSIHCCLQREIVRPLYSKTPQPFLSRAAMSMPSGILFSITRACPQVPICRELSRFTSLQSLILSWRSTVAKTSPVKL